MNNISTIISLTITNQIFFRKTIPEEEQNEIFDDIKNQLQKLEITRKKMKRSRTFVRPVKLA